MASVEDYMRQGHPRAVAEAWALDDEEAESRAQRPDQQPCSPEPVSTATAPNPVGSGAGADFATELAYLNHPAPCGANGRDETGLIVIRVDERRLPVRLGVADWWKKRVPSLGAAVMQAYSDALANQRAEARRHGIRPEPIETPPFDLSDYEGVPPRTIENYNESAIGSFEKFDRIKNSPPSKESHCGDKNRIRTFDLEFHDNWLTNCRVNEDWAKDAAAVTIMTEFSKALNDALRNDSYSHREEGPREERQKELNQLAKEMIEIAREGIAAISKRINSI